MYLSVTELQAVGPWFLEYRSICVLWFLDLLLWFLQVVFLIGWPGLRHVSYAFDQKPASGNAKPKTELPINRRICALRSGRFSQFKERSWLLDRPIGSESQIFMRVSPKPELITYKRLMLQYQPANSIQPEKWLYTRRKNNAEAFFIVIREKISHPSKFVKVKLGSVKGSSTFNYAKLRTNFANCTPKP